MMRRARIPHTPCGSTRVGSRRKGGLRLTYALALLVTVILAFASAVSLVLRQWIDAGIILAIVLGSALLCFLQESNAPQQRKNSAKTYVLSFAFFKLANGENAHTSLYSHLFLSEIAEQTILLESSSQF